MPIGYQDSEQIAQASPMAVMFQHGNTNSLSFPGVVTDRVGDLADVVVFTAAGPLVQYGVAVVDCPVSAGPNTCWPLPVDLSPDELRARLVGTFGNDARRLDLDLIVAELIRPSHDIADRDYRLAS
jgi:hypothetical protein